ncbi:FAD:protein FMN transferase [Oceanospirillum linum]|uniref:FAD:protein FMN transferase n=1 Tax=Oceanospirillum linum TaxID=966 RepID=UPI00089F4C1D|nr:FAD:protein FMN transferase [Oceanospirillum linum]SEF50712.1 thiamine biosynthesis lipoprotein [Oleiphilus messinensis]SMP03901.1 thiamine biosynthesis lipoprotein [Oceanospirillum linum]
MCSDLRLSPTVYIRTGWRQIGKLITGSLSRLGQALKVGLALIGLALLAGCDSDPVVIKFSGPIMGTQYHVSVVESEGLSLGEAERQLLAQGIKDSLVDIDLKMSTYKSSSELSRFNQMEAGEWFPVSMDTAAVVNEALLIAEESGGAFDPTIGPLVNLWGFGPDLKPDQVPSEAELALAFERVGYHSVQVKGIEGKAPAIRKNKAIYLDLSAIAKGYAVDQVARYLQKQGYQNYLVEVGGELQLKGRKPDGSSWRIAIEKPDTQGQVAQQVLAVTDVAVATSGGYRNYFEADGQRYSHTINPLTGLPITHKLASVTVLHASCATADALATTLMVMGPEKGLKFARQQKLAVYMLVKAEEGFDVIQTEQFTALTNQNY